MMNPQSNCFAWRTAYDTAFSSDPEAMTGLIAYLDDAKKAWCNDAQTGLLTPECNCLAFPIKQQKQCDAQSVVGRGCSQNDTADCPGRTFIRNNDGCSGCCRNTQGEIIPCTGQYIQIQTAACVPFYCWVAECLDPNAQLLTSQIVASTLQDGICYQGLCISVIGTDVINVNNQDLMPPNATSGTFSPGYSILASCGAPANPLPLITPTIYELPVNQVRYIPVIISNSGDYNLLLTLATTAQQPNVPWATAPSNITVPSKGITQFYITVNQPLLLAQYNIASGNGAYPVVTLTDQVKMAENGALPALSWTYTYSWEGTTQMFMVDFGSTASPQLGLVLYPPSDSKPSNPTVNKPQNLPWQLWAGLGIVLGLFLFAILRAYNADKEYLDVEDQATSLVVQIQQDPRGLQWKDPRAP